MDYFVPVFFGTEMEANITGALQQYVLKYFQD